MPPPGGCWYTDGSALFWRASAFSLVRERRTAFRAGGGSHVCVLATLRHVASGRTVVAGATHLKAKPSAENEALRTAQAQEYMALAAEEAARADADTEGDAAAAAVAAAVATTGGRVGRAASEARPRKQKTPVILMGDFNTDPVDAGNVAATCVPAVLSSKALAPPLRSAYALPAGSVGGGGGGGGGAGAAVSYSTWKVRGDKSVKHIIDYVFHNGEAAANGLRLTDTLGVPDEAEVEPTRFPGFRYPSDHVMIGAKFALS